jgi:uncharacterized protein
MTSRLFFPGDKISSFCQKNGIKSLALFGSALRDDFGPDSDVDLLVEFLPGCTPGLLGISRMERELSEILQGKRVDLRTPEDLSQYFRAKVQKEAEVQYVHG